MLEKDTSLSSFSEEDISSLLNSVVALSIAKYLEQEHPRAILLVGQPGAGKTALSAMVTSSMAGDAAFINGDDYRRHHPSYRKLYKEYGFDAVQMTSTFSNAVVERLIDELSDRHINLVVEGTGRDAGVPEKTAALLNGKGYAVELMALAVRPEWSLISTLLRFYQMNGSGTTPRATALTAHDLVVDRLPVNLDILRSSHNLSRITIWDRDLNQLYNSTMDDIMPSDVLREYWDRPWLEEELRSAREQVEALRAMEQTSKLGQGSSIDELERRIDSVGQTQSFDMTLQ